MATKEQSNWKALIRKLNVKYRLVVLDDATLEEKLSFKLSRLNTFMTMSILVVFSVLFTIATVIYTPLKQYIPGYQDVTLRRDLISLNTKSDSLTNLVDKQSEYITYFRKMFDSGIDKTQYIEPGKLASIDTANIDFSDIDLDNVTADESKVREAVKNDLAYTLSGGKNDKDRLLRSYFTRPIEGFIVQNFDPENEHFGLDIGSQVKDAQVMAIADGVVIMNDWTLDTGHVIAIQHTNNLISFYKHNAVTLKKLGNFVEAGDAIAILGNTGELTSGPHLHLELWHNQTPVDPLNYISL